MRQKSAGPIIAVLLVIAVLAGVRFASNIARDLPAHDAPAAPAPVVDDAKPAPAAEPSESVATPLPPLQEFASDCFRSMRLRNPIGRIVSLTANLADTCSAIVETDTGSARWLFDWRDRQRGFVHEGEMRWPDTWPPALPDTGIADSAFDPDLINALMTQTRALWPGPDQTDWIYEIIWLPAPFSRPLTFITLADQSPGAVAYAGNTAIYDGSELLPDDQYEAAYQLYPMTRFELREDHNFKGALYESTALAEAAVSLEGGEEVGAVHPLAANAEHCMHWLHTINSGSRVLRLAISADQCYLLLANSTQRDDFYLVSASGSENYTEHPSLRLTPPSANLLLDRSRLSSARVRERLAQAQAQAGANARIERLAIAWVAGAMVWQFDGQVSGARDQIYLDEAGAVIATPAEFPVSALEHDAGFRKTRPLLEFAGEAQ